MAFNLEQVDVDGAVREAADAVSGDTRLSFLKKGALAGGAAFSGGAVLSALTAGTAAAASTDRQRPPAATFGSGNTGVLNYALTLEYLESTFYTEAAKHHVAKGDKQLEAYLKVTKRDEDDHVKVLKSVLGSKAVKKPAFDFGDTVTDKAKFIATAYVLENTGVHAYHGQLTNIKGTAYLLAAAEIATVEGRHAGAIGIIAGKTIAPTPLDTPLGAGQVLAAVKATGFIKS